MKSRAWIPPLVLVLALGLWIVVKPGEAGLARAFGIVAVLSAIMLGCALEIGTRRKARATSASVESPTETR